MQTLDIQEEPQKDTLTLEEDDPYGCMHQQQAIRIMPNGWNVFPSFWLRRSVQNDFRLHQFLLDYNFRFLPYIGIVLWAIFLLQSAFSF